MKRYFSTLLALWLASPAFAAAPSIPPITPIPSWPLNADSHLDPPPVFDPYTVKPGLHLQGFAAAARVGRPVNVCLTGDSTSTVFDYATGTGGANAVTPGALLATLLEAKFRADNPGVSVNFINRAVGAQTWATLGATATANWPSWYAFTGMPWLSYIRGADCDTDVINSGVNDTNGLTATQIFNVLSKIAGWGNAPSAWSASTVYAPGSFVTDSNGDLEATNLGGTSGGSSPTWPASFNGTVSDGTVGWVNVSGGVYTPRVPDIILVTNKGATPTAGAPYNTTVTQVGYLTAAAFQRTLSKNGGAALGIAGLPPIGLIDIGRYFNQVYGYQPGTNSPATGSFQGFDPTRQIPTTVTAQAGAVATAYPYSFAFNPGGDGDYDVTFAGQASALGAAATQVIFNIGGPNSGITSNVLKIFKSGSLATVQMNIDGVIGTVGKGTSVSGGAWGSADLNIKVSVRGAWLWVYVNQTLIAHWVIPRWVGPYTPTVTLASAPTGTTTMTVNSQVTGTPINTRAIYSDNAIFNLNGAGTGGNGINHDSGWGIAGVDAAVVDSLNLCGVCNLTTSAAPLPTSVTTASYTVLSTDTAITYATSATNTTTLPLPSTYAGRTLLLRTTAAFAINSASSNVVPLAGGAAGSAILAATSGKWARLQSDGTNWNVIEGN